MDVFLRPAIEKQELRPYQALGLDEIRRHYANGVKRVLLYLATGGGKTRCFCEVLIGVKEKGKRAIMVVRGKGLVNQASQRLFANGVEHGVMQGDHWNFNPAENIQICSIDTLYRRKIVPEADLIVIDEAHLAGSPSFLWLFEHYPDAFFLPVTATPHPKGGLRHIADEVVYPITITELIAQGFLVPPRYYAPSAPDLSRIKVDKRTGDYNSQELTTQMSKETTLVGDIISHYRKYAADRPTVAFAVSKAHSRQIVDAFNDVGIVAVHIDDSTPDDEREKVLLKLKAGEVKVVSNVGILTTGVDMPYVSALIVARPTKSANLHIQMLGRGTRPYKDKADFIVLDHAGNLDEHGLIECERPCDLDGKMTIAHEPTVTCEECFNVWNPVAQWIEMNPEAAKEGKTGRDYICRGLFPEAGVMRVCGHDNTPAAKPAPIRKTDVDGTRELVEIKGADEFKNRRLAAFVERQILKAIQRNYKPGYVFHAIKERFGEDDAKKFWHEIRQRVPMPQREA